MLEKQQIATLLVGEVVAMGDTLLFKDKDGITLLTLNTSTGVLTPIAGSQVGLDSGIATSTANAATISKQSGVITTEALTTAGLAAYTMTLTNTKIAATSKVFVSVFNGSNTQGTVVVGTVTPGSGSAVILIQNVHATQALNGTLKIAFVVFN